MPTHQQYSSTLATIDATIANGQTTSGVIDLAGTTLCGIHLPSAFTGTSLSFLAAPSAGGTYQTVQRSGADLSITVVASRYAGLNPADFAGIQFLKIVSGGAEGAARTLTLAVRPV